MPPKVNPKRDDIPSRKNNNVSKVKKKTLNSSSPRKTRSKISCLRKTPTKTKTKDSTKPISSSSSIKTPLMYPKTTSSKIQSPSTKSKVGALKIPKSPSKTPRKRKTPSEDSTKPISSSSSLKTPLMYPKTQSKGSSKIKTPSTKWKVPPLKVPLWPFPKSPSIPRRMKFQEGQQTPKDGVDNQPIPCSSSTADSSVRTDRSEKVKKEMEQVTPEMMKYFLNAYKQSPQWDDLKNKRFNKSFYHEYPRGDRSEIIPELFPEDGEPPPKKENPFEEVDRVFKSLPHGIGVDDTDSDGFNFGKEMKKIKAQAAKRKRALRKRAKKRKEERGSDSSDSS